MLLSIVPIAYLLLKLFGIRPEYVFCVHIAVEFFTQIARMKIVLLMISMRIGSYVKEVLVPILKVLVIAPIVPLCFYVLLHQSVTAFLVVCLVSVLGVGLTVYYAGCTRSEQEYIRELVMAKVVSLKR